MKHELDIAQKLQNLIPSHVMEVVAPRKGRVFLRVKKERLREVIEFLKNEGFTHLSGITALETDDKFELLYHLGMEGTLLTVRVNLTLNNDIAPTITDIFPGALLYEREAHDLFGVKFEGNPNMKPLILPEDWPENIYPMRKNGRIKGERPKKRQKSSRKKCNKC
ncbi:MAG: NADH-quinone oxidoreductase subunit C [Candidatus Bathyarchaeia archaeon]